MNNFTLHTPTKILFGKGQVAQLVNSSRAMPAS